MGGTLDFSGLSRTAEQQQAQRNEAMQALGQTKGQLIARRHSIFQRLGDDGPTQPQTAELDSIRLKLATIEQQINALRPQ
jgi:hypothetical protein